MHIEQYPDDVKFHPWAVDTIDLKTRPRTLFVGESHYAGKEDANNRKLTQSVVHRAIEGTLLKSEGKAFFTNTAGIANNRILSPEERGVWWRSVAFYNYIQTPVGPKSRVPITLDLFEKAHSAFHAVLKGLDPDLIVVLGQRVWDNMSDFGASLAQPLHCLRVEPRFCEAWLYPTADGKTALAFHVKHPSSGFSMNKFHPLYLAARARLSA